MTKKSEKFKKPEVFFIKNKKFHLQPKLIHVDTRQITKEMVSDFKKATRQLSGGWRNNNPPMDFYQNSSQR